MFVDRQKRAVAAGGAAFFKQVVDKHDTMPDKAVVTYRDQLANKTVRLYLAIITDNNALLYFYIRNLQNCWSRSYIRIDCKAPPLWYYPQILHS